MIGISFEHLQKLNALVSFSGQRLESVEELCIEAGIDVWWERYRRNPKHRKQILDWERGHKNDEHS